MKKDKEWLTNEIEGMGTETSESYPHEQMVDREAVLNLIDQLDEPEKVVVPQFVDDFIKCKEKESLDKWKVASSFIFSNIKYKKYNPYEWSQEEGNMDKFLSALVNGYAIEKEPLYYAKIKGHELIDTEPILDDDTGKDVSEWNRNIYFIQQLNKKIVIDMKDSGLNGAKHFMTLEKWNELGINDSNADFELV